VSGRPPSRPLRPEERAVWNSVARTVRPLSGTPAPEDQAPSRATPDPTPAPSDADAVSRETFARYLDPRAPAPQAPRRPAERGGEKKVRRGKVEIEARFDLHGHTEASGRRALLRFLNNQRRRGAKTVLVITGKGASARAQDQRRFEPWDPEARPLPGVLKRALPRWLSEPDFAAIVSGYAEAHAKHGGTGAFYVMLRG